MKRFTLILSLLMIASITFGQNAMQGTHALMKKKQDVTLQGYDFRLEGGEVVWSTDFEEDPAIYTLGHDPSTTMDWAIDDTTSSTVTFVNGTDFNDDDIPVGTEVTAPWLYMGHRNVADYSESGNNFAWLDCISGYFAGSVEIFNAWIQYDNIDMSGVNNPKLMMYQNYKAFNGDFCYFEYSIDGGTTWETVELNVDVEGNTYGDAQLEYILPIALAGEANVSIRFRWETTGETISGMGYGWQIDDIQIIENYDHDMRLMDARINFFEYIDYTVAGDESYFHSSSHYGMIPEEQIMADGAAMVFNGSVENWGNITEAPTLNVKAFDPNETELYNEEDTTGSDYETTQGDTLDLLTPEFTIDAETQEDITLGEYLVTFDVMTPDENDMVPENNTDSLYFQITDYVYARDMMEEPSASTGPGVWLDGGVDGDMIATSYTFNYTTTIEKLSVYISEESTTGTSLSALLYYYDEDDEAWAELSQSALQIIDTEDKIGAWMDIEFPNDINITPEASGSITIRAAIAFYYGDSEDNELMIGYDPNQNASSWGASWYFMEGSDPQQWYSITNWNRGGLAIRLLTPASHTGIADEQLEDVNVYPNPTTGIINVNNVRGAEVEVYDMIGKLVYSADNLDDVARINLGDLNNGTYILRVIKDNKVKTQKVNLMK